MAELILTEEELNAQTWFELPDETVGKLTKYSAAKMMEQCQGVAGQRDQTWQFAMMLVMVDWCMQAGAQGIEQVIHNFHNATGEHGDWKIIIERLPTMH